MAYQEKQDERDVVKQLIESVKDKEPDAFSAFYNHFKNYVFYLALKISKTREDAEDITQETFIEAFKKIRQLKRPEAIYGWLSTIIARKS